MAGQATSAARPGICFCAQGCTRNSLADPGVFVDCRCWCHNRSRPASGQVEVELPEGADPYECEACLRLGRDCEFHRGFAAGWDLFLWFVARAIHEQTAGDVGDVGGAG